MGFRPESESGFIGKVIDSGPLSASKFLDQDDSMPQMEKLAKRIGQMRERFERLVQQMKSAQEDVENEVKKATEKQMREAVGETTNELPEGVVSNEFKCNNGEVITGLPAPT